MDSQSRLSVTSQGRAPHTQWYPRTRARNHAPTLQVQLLSNFDVRINLVPDRGCKMPEPFQDSAAAIAAQRGAKSNICEVSDLHDVIGQTDVLYFAGRYLHDWKMQIQRQMKPSAMLMHSDPRMLFKSPCSRPSYYKQLGYSQSVRAALLCMVLGKL